MSTFKTVKPGNMAKYAEEMREKEHKAKLRRMEQEEERAELLSKFRENESDDNEIRRNFVEFFRARFNDSTFLSKYDKLLKQERDDPRKKTLVDDFIAKFQAAEKVREKITGLPTLEMNAVIKMILHGWDKKSVSDEEVLTLFHEMSNITRREYVGFLNEKINAERIKAEAKQIAINREAERKKKIEEARQREKLEEIKRKIQLEEAEKLGRPSEMEARRDWAKMMRGEEHTPLSFRAKSPVARAENVEADKKKNEKEIKIILKQVDTLLQEGKTEEVENLLARVNARVKELESQTRTKSPVNNRISNSFFTQEDRKAKQFSLKK